ncbi:histidine kinase [Chlorogloea sp. CCALA 695]|uniref:histidine kinase n=1 Tax=Chlorogloea sp. CCALA 695 TaxID=2107693 RepID=UPI000D071873|nr:histidine kinase [Chlorogloea sp. CCALA 695]PSB34797.1 histidine kinase [Chlorogloea sp. CCALA 695]
MQVLPQSTYSQVPLQLLLFVDERPSARSQELEIRRYLKQLQADYPWQLQIINVGEQPYLVEHFKLVATPALVKIHPVQVIAGSNLDVQIKTWWFRWQQSVAAYLKVAQLPEILDQDYNINLSQSTIRSVSDSAELIKLTDEIFRLKREQEKLTEQLQFKDRVIAMLAHDLRNPLTAVSIALETLEANLVVQENKVSRLKPELAAQLFKQARNQAKSIDRMIAGLLQVAHGTGAQLHIQPTKLDINALCTEVLSSQGDRSQAKFQTLETDLPADLPCVYADSERLRQVLVNLLDNAIKYTPENGTIRLSVLHRTSQKAQVSICDTGPGIPPEARDRIFEERVRLERDQTLDGYGIGLSLCQSIINAHYGQIWVDSPLSGGSCFHFTIPIYPA